MKIFLVTFFPLLLSVQLVAQLDTVRWYRQKDNHISRTSTNQEIDVHPVYGRNELIVVENYDVEKRLVNRVTTLDENCFVGNYSAFYENGKTKEIGQYLQCDLKDGIWSSLSMNGDTLTKELWNNGEFVREIIKQEYNSLWSYKLLVDGKDYRKEHGYPGIDINDFKMSITFLFKNDLPKGKEHSIEAKLLRGTHVINEKEFASDNDFNKFNHQQWCKENGLKSGDRIFLGIYQSMNKDTLVGWYNISVK